MRTENIGVILTWNGAPSLVGSRISWLLAACPVSDIGVKLGSVSLWGGKLTSNFLPAISSGGHSNSATAETSSQLYASNVVSQ